MQRRTIIFFIVIAIIAIGATGYFGYQSAQPQSASAEPIKPTTVFASRGDVKQTIAAPGRVERVQQQVLSMRVAGPVAAIHVRPGDAVRAGDALLELDTVEPENKVAEARSKLEQAETTRQRQIAVTELSLRAAEARLEQASARVPGLSAAEADVKSAQAELNALLRGPDADKVAEAQAAVANAEAKLRQAQAAYDQVKHVPEIAMLPQALELETTTNDLAAAQARLDQVRGTDPAQIAVARAHLEKAQADRDKAGSEQTASAYELDILLADVEKEKLELEHLQAGADPELLRTLAQAEADLQATTLRAPMDGVVLEIAISPGESILAGQRLMVMADPNAVEIYTTVIEEDLPLVQPGQQVEIFFDASADLDEVIGEVSRIVPKRTGSERPLYPVYLALDGIPPGILPGMTADSTIITDQRQDVLRLPRGLVRTRADGTGIVRVWEGGRTEERSVSVGLRGDVYFEILDGLVEGDEVVEA